MFLDGLYQRLLVTAGAVAFVVVNWLCRPVQRRSSRAAQAVEAEAEALLGACEEVSNDKDIKDGVNASHSDLQYEAPKLSTVEAFAQLRDGAPVAPEDVSLQPMHALPSALRPPCDFSMREINDKHRHSGDETNSAGPASSGQDQQPPISEVAVGTTCVDEAYLKSLLDQELGPPKFVVLKPAPQPSEPRKLLEEPSADEGSLQALLDQAFGPPRFAVPKPVAADSASLGGAISHVSASMDSRALPEAPTTLFEYKLLVPGEQGATSKVVPPPDAAGAGASMAAGACGVAGVKRTAEERDGDPAASVLGEAEAALAPQAVNVLTLVVTHGPAQGKRAMADDQATQHIIGRLPESWMQLLDQEVSGRHAAVRWDGATSCWMLRDVGSLNGTSLAGVPIGREYKVPGEEHPLAHGDAVQLGSYTVLKVELATACSGPTGVSATSWGSSLVGSKRHHGNVQDGGGYMSSGSFDRSHLETLVGLPAPGLLVDCPELGARLCVHNRLGVDHRRMGQGCEDVPHWELPFAPYDGAGIICMFDGHHGSKAAYQAKEYLPAVLRAKLLRRDGRQSLPLPPPPPLPPRRPDDDDEEDLIDAYDGVTSEEALEPVAEEVEWLDYTKEEEEEPRNGGGAGSNALSNATEPSIRCCIGDDGVGGEAPGGHVRSVEGAEEGTATELLPPPPEGPSLPPLLTERDMDSQQALLRDTFLVTDLYMSLEEGCTATLVLLEAVRGLGRDQDLQQQQRAGWTLQSANVGDSSAVLVNLSRGSWCKLSADHRIASSLCERERLAAIGHAVKNRLYGLNISRMLGDRFMKLENLGFLAEPFVGSTVQVGPNEHALLIVASDGLWDVLPEDKVASVLLKEVLRASLLISPQVPTSELCTTSTSSSGVALPPAGVPTAGGSAASVVPPSASLTCQVVADLLLTRALKERSKDDITISVLELGPHLWGQQSLPQQQNR